VSSRRSRAAKRYPELGSQEGGQGREVKKFLRGYVGGGKTRPAFRMSLDGLTPFQKKVLKKISEIPCGAVLSYGELAKRVGKPSAARAVGNACGRNPLPVVIPCHRVVAKDGLGGFSAPFRWKRALLKHEGYLQQGTNQ